MIVWRYFPTVWTVYYRCSTDHHQYYGPQIPCLYSGGGIFPVFGRSIIAVVPTNTNTMVRRYLASMTEVFSHYLDALFIAVVQPTNTNTMVHRYLVSIPQKVFSLDALLSLYCGIATKIMVRRCLASIPPKVFPHYSDGVCNITVVPPIRRSADTLPLFRHRYFLNIWMVILL